MKVFISSVTHLLKEERANLPPFLGLLGHQGLRFEDFTAQDRSSRQACLAGVDEADVYVLLLGPKYGQQFPDTGLSPTAEEFTRARRRGIPILVFTKVTDEVDETDQTQFKDEIGHYVNGRQWKSFTDPVSCNQAVGEALAELQLDNGPLRKAAISKPAEFAWLANTAAPDRYLGGAGRTGFDSSRGGGLVPSSVYAGVLELHLAPEDMDFEIGLRDLTSLAERLAADARSTQFVSAGDPMDVGAAPGIAWAIRPPETGGRTWGQGLIEERFRGLIANSAGAVGAFISLPADSMGTLVDQAALQRYLAQLFGLASPHVAESERVAVAAGLMNADRIWEGDPNGMGARTSGSMRTRQGASIRVVGNFLVPAKRLATGFGDVGADFAVEMLHDLRALT